MPHYLVIGKLPDLLSAPAALFFACGARDGFVALSSDVPLAAAINPRPRIVRQLMSADLLAGLVEGLDEFAGEVRTLVVGVAGYPADLAVRPVRCVGLLSAEI